MEAGDTGNLLVIIGLVVAAGLALTILIAGIVGAIALFRWAATQGFVGLAAYIACWVFLFPFMVVACVIAGGFVAFASSE